MVAHSSRVGGRVCHKSREEPGRVGVPWEGARLEESESQEVNRGASVAATVTQVESELDESGVRRVAPAVWFDS